jgi:hypothetical protein
MVWYFPYSHGFVCFHLLCAESLVESFVVVAWWSHIILVSVYCGRFLLLPQFWMIVWLGTISEGWSYFHSVPEIPHFMSFLLFKFCWEVCCYFDGFTFLCYLFFFSYSLQYFFSVLHACCFKDNMHGEVLFWSSLFGVLETSCTWKDKTFSRFGKFMLLFYWIYYVSLWLVPLLLQCPGFSDLAFWWSHWVLIYSFHSSWVVWLKFLLFFL